MYIIYSWNTENFRYPVEHARQATFLPSIENILLFLENAKDGELLKRSLIKHIPYGSLMLDHCLMVKGFPANTQVFKYY